MNNLPRFRAKVMAGWLCTSTLGMAADPPAGGTNIIVEQARVRAVEAGDREVIEAVEYNQLHLRAIAAEATAARPALEALAESGDAFTVAWLEGPQGGPVAVALQPLAARAVEQIQARLRASPEVPERAAQDWMLRAAVSDLTCNKLEVPLKRFLREWLARHDSEPAVRRQLEQLTTPGERTGHIHDPSSIRARAASSHAPVPPSPSAAPRSSGQAKD